RTVLPISLLHFPTRRSPPPRATRFPYTTLFRSPGGTILYEAHKALEQICVERDTLHYKQQIALKYADLVYNGQWFHPLREALQADRKSTRLNSSHDQISYAVFCLKKKKIDQKTH